ncbi:Aminotransferase-like plant mobile domain, partial [Arabidopsis suecica]
MTITLDQVALVLGLDNDGDLIVGSKVGDEVAMDMCGRLLGKLPSAANKEVNCSRVKLNWLKRTLSECPEDASFHVVKCSTIFATTDGDKVSVEMMESVKDTFTNSLTFGGWQEVAVNSG